VHNLRQRQLRIFEKGNNGDRFTITRMALQLTSTRT
jgi:hypothetical protein